MKNLEDEVGEIIEDTLAKYSLDEQLWILQDQFLQGWIVFAISQSEVNNVFGLKSSRKIWKALEATYASLSEMTVLQLRSQLQSTKKGSLKITDYCQKMKKIAD